jgi:hypothetical protein
VQHRELAQAGHSRTFVVAYPAGEITQSSGGVQFADNDKYGSPVSDQDLEWLLAQPGLPDEFRRAAAVHRDS